MRQIFQQDLEQIGHDLQKMTQLVIAAIENGTTALREADLELAEQVIQNDEQIDAVGLGIDEMSVSLLARQQPVATDLRVIVTALRISATVERMGDLARHIAYIARNRFPERATNDRQAVLFGKMSEAAVDAAHQVAKLLESRDLALAAEVERDDDTLDALHAENFTLLLDDDIALTRQQTVDGVLLGRYFERFGDHAVSVARRISFLVTGDLTNAVSYATDGESEV